MSQPTPSDPVTQNLADQVAVPPPFVVGIIGGVASGKSCVTEMFQERGAQVISADKIAHQVLREPAVVATLVERFGTEILEVPQTLDHPIAASAPSIDRKKLGAIVFGDSEQNTSNRKALEAIVHPKIRQLGRQELARILASKECKYVLLDVPLLIEGGWHSLCNKIIYIDTPVTLRIQLAKTRGWTEEQLRQREAAQISLSEKRRHATDVLVNESNVDQLRANLSKIISRWDSMVAP